MLRLPGRIPNLRQHLYQQYPIFILRSIKGYLLIVQEIIGIIVSELSHIFL